MFNWLFGNNNDSEVVHNELRRNLVVLIVMDGFGIHPDVFGNAVLQANTPFLDLAWSKGKSTLLNAAGTYVGLPNGEVGNSEVGHLNIGAGLVVYQSLPMINDDITSGKLKQHPVLQEAINQSKRRNSDLHLMGILSAGGVHGHIDHLFYLLEMCKAQGVNPYIHAFLDGRDTGPNDGYFYLSKLIQKIKQLGVGRIATLSGRFYSMDRDNRWERIQASYEAMVGKAQRYATDPFAIIQEAYKNGENDQIFKPTGFSDAAGNPIGAIKSNDVCIMYNYREDRAREITKAFALPEFDNFERVNYPQNLHFVTFTGYETNLPVQVVFPPKVVEVPMTQVISERGLKQLHISETEKFMHVTYFFDGARERPFINEDIFNVPSPKVMDYSKTPEMSAEIIKDEVIYRLNNLDKNRYSFVLINFANPDMLGHTGDLPATIKGVEFTDKCVREVVSKTVEVGGCAILIADHGNCETMIDRATKQVDTAHTPNPVPLIIVSEENQLQMNREDIIYRVGTGPKAVPTGLLADVAPTVLNILGIENPTTMTGINLLDVV